MNKRSVLFRITHYTQTKCSECGEDMIPGETMYTLKYDSTVILCECCGEDYLEIGVVEG